MRYFVLRDADYFWSYDPSENYNPYSFYVYSLDAGQILKSVATWVYCVSRILLGHHKLMPQDFGHNQFPNYTWLRGLEIHRSWETSNLLLSSNLPFNHYIIQ